MCGIAGVLDPHPDQAIDPAALERAAKLLHHRGPDGGDVWVGPGAALAHTRLAIIDIEGGGQPMHSEDGRYVVVFNGEIYNHRDLRSELEAHGARFRTRCDTEVLLHLYAWHGANMVGRLRGMFAFVVVDLLQRHALLARDRFGKKPLCYAERDGRLTFASTLDALVTLLPERPGLDMRAIAEYLVLQYVPAPLTPYERVSKLPPGHLAEWRDGPLDVRPFWEPPMRHPAITDRDEAAALVRERVGDAVRVRLESDVPIGVFLSGGLDSSVVVAEMATSGPRPKTFSVGFAHQRFDESRYARLVAERFGTDHTELVLDTDAALLFEEVVRAFDEPFADSSALATLAVARAASEHVTVVLTGDGGDETFGGNDRYSLFRRVQRLRRTVGPVAGLGGRVLEQLGGMLSRDRLVGGARFLRNPWGAYRDWLFHFRPSELAGLIHPDVLPPEAGLGAQRSLDDLWAASAAEASSLMWVDQQTYLPGDLLVKMDRATMAYGLEARSPLLDHALTAEVATFHPDLLFDAAAGKAILRAAYADVLPHEILTRPKMGFGVPLADWLQTDLRPNVHDLLLSDSAPLADILRRERVRALVDGGRLDGRDGYRVWNLLALAGWANARGIA